jgi:Family of unknown function (DUF6525)
MPEILRLRIGPICPTRFQLGARQKPPSHQTDHTAENANGAGLVHCRFTALSHSHLIYGPTLQRNLATSLRTRNRGCPMQSYDRLPELLRKWLSNAALPWSPPSVLALWKRAIKDAHGDREAALSRLNATEAKMLARDAVRVWAGVHPLLAAKIQCGSGTEAS